MGDTGGVKKEVKRRANKGSKINRIVSLFEIPRPHHKSKGVQRTNSLPSSSKRPSVASSEEDPKEVRSNTLGKVRRIKEEIEHKEAQVATPPKTNGKKNKPKHSSSAKPNKFEHQENYWQKDIQTIVDNISRLREHIEDVSPEIEHSDTELEIIHSKPLHQDAADVFFDSADDERRSDRDVLRDKCNSDENNYDFNRVSSETLKEDRHESSSSDIEANFVYFICSNASDEDHYSTADEVEANPSDDRLSVEIPNETELEIPDEESAKEDHTKEETNANGATESVQMNHNEDEPLSNNDPNEVDSIDWWKHKSFVHQTISNEPSSVTSTISNNESEASPAMGGRFIKNNQSIRNRRQERRRTGILQKPQTVKELAKHFDGFKQAAESGETENYRKSFIDEMDKELENMRNDGFTEDFHLSLKNLTLLSDVEDDDDCVKVTNNNSEESCSSALFPISITACAHKGNDEDPSSDDIFGETLFGEDLDNGLYYLESYNADGKELIMCSVQVNRRTVDLNSFDEMKKADSGGTHVVGHDDDLMLVLLGDAGSDTRSGTDSKRTTIYSTTSGESCEDEGIYIENNYAAARRETYCDDQGVVRIERVAPYRENAEVEYVNTTNSNYCYSGREETRRNEEENDDDEEEEENYYESIRLEHEILFSVPQVKKETLQYILEEIKSTERKYVTDMKKVLHEYKTFLEERCLEKVDVVFGNMEQIYQTQTEFLGVLEHPDSDVNRVIEAFICFEDLWRLYPRYFRNTPKANAAVKELSFLIKEKQDRIHDKLHLSAYLLTPLQRLGKYKLFLENIIKQLEKEEKPIGFAQMALEIVKNYMSKGNDAVAIASILHSPLHTKDYGSFITREKFLLIKPRRMEVMVFLFEGAVVFTTEEPKSMEQFVYHQSIKMNDLRIATFDDCAIHLTDYTKIKKRNSSKYTYVLDAKNDKLKAAWKQQIEDILWKQMQKIKENTLKEYQSGSKTPKKAMRSREQRSKSTGASVFYVE